MQPPTFRRMRLRAASLYVTSIGVAGTAGLVGVLAGAEHRTAPDQLELALLIAVCLAVTELRPVSWIRKRSGAEVTASWTFAYALMLVCPLGLALATVAAVSALSDALRHKPLRRVWFNAAQLVLALLVGAVVLEVLTGSHLQPDHPSVRWVLAVGLSASAVFAVNGILVGFVVALHGERTIVPTVRTILLLNVFTDGLLLAVAPILVATGTLVPELIPLLFVAIWAVYRSACVAEARQYEATHDLLTGLANRRSFQLEAVEALRQAKRRHQGMAVVIVDLDLFKHINDELGHDVGDMVLSEVGRRLDTTRRPTDVVARLGGDEFGVLFRPVDGADAAHALAVRVHDILQEPCTIKGFPVSVGASVGVALFPDHGADIDEVMRHADVAMYTAKHAGGGVQSYSSDRDRHRAGRVTLLSELASAIGAGQLVLEYQPKVHLASLEIVGAEALVRWEHPLYGTISPDRFVPVAEQTELMHRFTDWVLETAVRQRATWAKQDLPITIAVNVSAQNLRDPRFASRVAQALFAYRVEPTDLELELSESAVMSDPASAVAVLSNLRDMGVRLSLDDVGTGPCSLGSLRDLPIHNVKIDRAFVAAIADDARDRAIVRAIVDVAKHFDLATVAEGVESAAVLDLLVALGCDFGQGYFFAPPQPAGRVVDLAFARRAAAPPGGGRRSAALVQ
jgi:diguanylate cyclase (GGDEF)-like protein